MAGTTLDTELGVDPGILEQEVIQSEQVTLQEIADALATPVIVASQRPISVLNVLTNQIWGYNSISDMYGAAAFFTFANLPPSIYRINNASVGSIAVNLAGTTYTVAAGTSQDFEAHSNIRNQHIG